jgi:hypothetical protein
LSPEFVRVAPGHLVSMTTELHLTTGIQRM